MIAEKLIEIAGRHELDIIKNGDCLLINSYIDTEKYKIFNTKNDKSNEEFYKFFINELIKNIRTKDFFEAVGSDPQGYGDLFEDIAAIIKDSGELFRK